MRNRILQFLKVNIGEFISGEDISNRLNVSRAAICKHIKILRQEGYRIDSSSKRGYKLLNIPDKMLDLEIRDRLETDICGQKVYFFQEMDSTNNKAKELALNGEKEGTIVIAEKLTAGRGRLGRTWIAPPNKGIWFSIILRPKISSIDAANLNLIAAIAITKVLREKYKINVGIKWPNDILINDKKMCGILTEINAETDLVNFLVLGIGINVNLDENDFGEELLEKATSLLIYTGEKLNRVKLLQEILKELEVTYFCYLKEGFEKILSDFKKYNFTLQKEITINTWNKKIKCKAVDISNNGGLIVKLEDGTLKTFYSGDVSLKY